MKRKQSIYTIHFLLTALITISVLVFGCSPNKTSAPTPRILSIEITPTAPITVVVGHSQQFKATALYVDGSSADITMKVNWNSTSAAIATISPSGLATGVATGSTSITAALSGVTSTAVSLKVAILSSVEITPASPATLAVGTIQQLKATGYYSDGSVADITSQVTWLSSNTSVARISSDGSVTGVAAGKVDITATLDGVTGPAVSVPVAVLIAILITPGSSNSLEVYATRQFTALGVFPDGSQNDLTSQVVWSSSTSGIANVSQTGLATGLAIGQTDISATLSGVTSKSVNLQIVAAIPTLSAIQIIPVYPDTLPVGCSSQFKATGSYSDGSIVDISSQATWASSNTEIATVSPSGLATGIQAGNTNITATLSGKNSPATVLRVAVLSSIAVIPTSPAKLVVGSTSQFRATGTFLDGTVKAMTAEVTWFSSNISVATIAGGTVTGIDTGNTDITVTLAGVTSPPVRLTVVILLSIEITPVSPAVLTVNSTLQFKATGLYSDGSTADVTSQVKWNSSVTKVANISISGLATGVAIGSTNISAVLSDVTSKSVTLSVGM